ncbi:TVP38/TMEM64 family inner membrane protein YdjZ [Variibacter gotjawalensis]|uniref:Phospholipase D n=1 Tax=Variibacter gotjawalensis TaxID=1333996 RepID=A0A0S3Q0C8_9BRAD|nr:VTT domain-containing protein [Variibacter gotjawalensis]NIK47478.1 phosphatidylserine/phosphatidylglycerophosphate/cardiolipin synthase-like enzyme/uncharacterized membrane protein YdjX (TVP38/TMEM64 family) [Variibacter gotjawalensis]RZS49373.1 phosphatidylserine/phosphatidylglycerophosphate/cardiolipin synthase-like enzyme [Variibacter gotjawalensis]BAT61637.1 TVP38/TMEM64 family inner membrane protein YdjZ [Variibacter gotjawalensis]
MQVLRKPDAAPAPPDNEACLVPSPGRNVWRVEKAPRAAILIDAAAYYAAARAALMAAKHSVFIIGWDIDSRCRLVGESCEADDGLPASFSDFLIALTKRRPELQINILLWDYSLLYAFERELFPNWRWQLPKQIRLCLDNRLPIGSSQHQKIVVVDDALAFSGGLDLTNHRWDTPEHKLHHPGRVTPDGRPYGPFHDVQALVDGDAARAIAEIARGRWNDACGKAPKPLQRRDNVWPGGLEPDLRDIDVGIARTQPIGAYHREVREVEALFLDMLDGAEREIYIENQFLTYAPFAEKLAETLRRKPALEVVIVSPQSYGSWVEANSMLNGRIRFMKIVDDAGVSSRVRFVCPEVRDGEEIGHTMVHSKICIVDDRLLRVGSANLNNRSMGADTECDLVFIAKTDEQRAAVRKVRNTLLGEHCGVGAETIAQQLERKASLVGIVDATASNGHALQPIDDGDDDADDLAGAIEGIADPPQPLAAELSSGKAADWLARVKPLTILKLVLVVLAMAALPLAWHFTPLSKYANPEATRLTFAAINGSVWAPFVVVGAFVAGGLIAFPVTVLILVTAATFGPVVGLAYATAGSLASAVVLYLIGAWLGQDYVRRLLGGRLDRIRRGIVDRGVVAVALVRIIPIAPYSFVNLAAGAISVRLPHFVLGTLLGMAPGLVVMSLLGHQVFQIISEPTIGSVAALLLAITAWIAVSICVQIFASRKQRRGS